ncbi:acetyl-CoA carboxylase [Sporosarcina psychrophila]|uniref:acetyl-CoA carboxylase n=1 Tax=Sporosarcina psychrophila TaxID=1476 RepID=UPI00078C2288|nr:acetyl-CoA carboxylase [Sporosarcina psychrophila]AMQ07844.1 acetyl-CoA carboxylase biotin carboxyl carrier protein subunit [Sporosarcina psychrophila]
MKELKKIVSPIPGVFYRKSSPEEPIYAEEGQQIKAGDPIGLIEIMKTYQTIYSETDGTIVSFKVQHEQAIEAGQVLVEIK